MGSKSLRWKKPQACHFAIKNAAQKMACEFYEMAAGDNQFYHFYPSQDVFIEREWWRFIDAVEQSLWAILRGERDKEMASTGMTGEQIQRVKDETFDILAKQGTIPKDGKMVSMNEFAGIPAGHA